MVQDDDDATLVRRALAGDGLAFEAIVVRHGPAVRRVLQVITRAGDRADDAWQETFVSAHQALARWQGGGSLRPWLLAIARNAARKQLRERHDVAIDVDAFAMGVAAGWGADLDDALEAADVHARLHAALAELAADEREILVLRDLEGLSGDEVAGILGIGVPAMKSRLHRARLRLLARLGGPS